MTYPKLYIGLSRYVSDTNVSVTPYLLNYYVLLAYISPLAIAWDKITSGIWSLKKGMKKMRVQQMSIFS